AARKMAESREVPPLTTLGPSKSTSKSLIDTVLTLGVEDLGATARSAPREQSTELLGAKPKTRAPTNPRGEVMSDGAVDPRSGPDTGATGGNTGRQPRLGVAGPSALHLKIFNTFSFDNIIIQ